MDEQRIEAELLRLGSQWAGLLQSSDAERANRIYERLYELVQEMRALPDRGEAALKRVTLLADDEQVRIFAAAAILSLDEGYAIRILQDIAIHARGLTSLTAEMTIREWRAGALRSYWQ